MFNKLAKSIKKNHVETATELFVMIVESVVAYKRGMMKTAEEIVGKIEATLKNRPNIDDRAFFNYITGGPKPPQPPWWPPHSTILPPPSQSPFSLKYKQNMEFRREV
jgi:hypothetical protein